MERIKKETIINIMIFVLFAVLTFIVGIHHEPWADEAQAWLIARDCTISEMVSNVLRYEGAPVLWFFILKCLQFFDFPYENLFLIPFVCSVLGVYLFLFKSKFPNIVKWLFPFTFFIFYQYTVVARNYSLIFPMLAIIAVYYEKRLKHPFVYSILLILTASISAHAYVIAFVLLVFFIIDIIKQNNCSIKKYIPPAIILLIMIFTFFYMKKPPDCTFAADINLMRLNPIKIVGTVTKAFFNVRTTQVLYLFFVAIVISNYIFSCKTFCKTKYQFYFYTLLNLSVAVISTILYCNHWHSGYFIVTYMFSIWILINENKLYKLSFKDNKMFYILFYVVFIPQLLWSVQSSIYDLTSDFCASRRVANFIKDNHLENKPIYGLGFRVIAIQPYFSKNVYRNFGEKSYWEWKQDALDKMEEKNKLASSVIIVDVNTLSSYSDIINKVAYNYDKYEFKANLTTKGVIRENTSFIVFVQRGNI